jgi:hypothetical protein
MMQAGMEKERIPGVGAASFTVTSLCLRQIWLLETVRCWSFFVDLAAFGLLVSRDRTKRLNPKRTAMIVFGSSRKLVSHLSFYSLVGNILLLA